jgi:hypothetical protein
MSGLGWSTAAVWDPQGLGTATLGWRERAAVVVLPALLLYAHCNKAFMSRRLPRATKEVRKVRRGSDWWKHFDWPDRLGCDTFRRSSVL